MPCINYTSKADSKKQQEQEQQQQQQHLLNRTVSLLAEPQGPVPDISGPDGEQRQKQLNSICLWC